MKKNIVTGFIIFITIFLISCSGKDEGSEDPNFFTVDQVFTELLEDYFKNSGVDTNGPSSYDVRLSGVGTLTHVKIEEKDTGKVLADEEIEPFSLSRSEYFLRLSHCDSSKDGPLRWVITFRSSISNKTKVADPTGGPGPGGIPCDGLSQAYTIDSNLQ